MPQKNNISSEIHEKDSRTWAFPSRRRSFPINNDRFRARMVLCDMLMRIFQLLYLPTMRFYHSLLNPAQFTVARRSRILVYYVHYNISEFRSLSPLFHNPIQASFRLLNRFGCWSIYSMSACQRTSLHVTEAPRLYLSLPPPTPHQKSRLHIIPLKVKI